MIRKQILDNLPVTESHKSRVEEILNELDSINIRLSLHQSTERINFDANTFPSDYSSDLPYGFYNQVLVENFHKNSTLSSILDRVSIETNPYSLDNIPSLISSGPELKSQFGLPEFIYSGIDMSEWTDDRQKIHEYFQKYRETGQLLFLYQIHQIIVKQKQVLQDGYNKLRNEIRYLRNKLLSSFQRITGCPIKNLGWFHVKRFNIDSDDEDPLIYTLVSLCIFKIFKLINRIGYELFRKRNNYREVELCYPL